ncbi:hypothetical protein FACS1894181_01260 [Bacteroidia bacterium]|nr:hypothetical protein FACS1894181_01260 [Bacteroidia bacterium]
MDRIAIKNPSALARSQSGKYSISGKDIAEGIATDITQAAGLTPFVRFFSATFLRLLETCGFLYPTAKTSYTIGAEICEIIE